MTTNAQIQNDILIRQDGDSIFPILQARQYRWRVAERWQILQLVIVVFIPAIMTVIALLAPCAKSAISMFAVLITFFDVGLIDRQYRKAIKTAARMSELMDIQLFRLPWNKLAAGDEPPPEEVKRSARRGKAMKRDHRWKGWYSCEIGPVPFAIARTISQRTNIEYDSDLRRIYILILQTLLVVAFALAVIIGMALHASLTNFVLSGLVPASPLVVWALREQLRQKDAVEGYAPVRAEAEKILSAAVAGKQSGAELELDSRLLQNAIFLRRASTVLLMPGIYKMRRSAAEEAMHDGAKYWVDRWREDTGSAPATDQSA